jgi:GNAT superfamily N-acetyltransferase
MADIAVRPALGRFDALAAVLGPSTPGGGACWCMSQRDGRVANEARPGEMRRLCEAEPGPGVLLFVDDEPAGWCSVAPRESHRRLLRSRTIPAVDDRERWSIVCVVVRAGHRRQGYARVLVEGAVTHAAAHGADLVEAYPVQSEGRRVRQAAAFTGTVDLFADAGFELVMPTDAHSDHLRRWIMRRELGTR